MSGGHCARSVDRFLGPMLDSSRNRESDRDRVCGLGFILVIV